MTQAKIKAPRKRQALAKAATADVLVDTPKRRSRKPTATECKLVEWPSLAFDTQAIARAVSASTEPVAENGHTVTPDVAAGAVSRISAAPTRVSGGVTVLPQPKSVGSDLRMVIVHFSNAVALAAAGLRRWSNARITELNGSRGGGI